MAILSGPVSRRRLVRFVGLAVGAAALGPVLAACGPAAPPTTAPKPAEKPAAEPTKPAAPAPAATKPAPAPAATKPAAPATAAAPAATKPAAAPAATAPAASAAATKPSASGGASAGPGGRPTATLDDYVKAAAPFKGKTINILMSAGPWGKAHDQMLPEFNKATGMNVKFDSIPENQIATKLQTSVLSKSGDYDAVVMVWDWIAQYYKAGLLADLTPMMNDPQMPAFDVKEYPERIVQFLQRDGKLYGLPVSVAAQIMMYRKDIFEQAGVKGPGPNDVVTWQQVYEWAKQLNKPPVYGVLHHWAAAQIYSDTMNVLPAEKPILDQERRWSILRDPKVIETYEIWRKEYQEGLMTKEVFSYATPDGWAKFQAGQAAMHPTTWPAAIGLMEDPEKSKVAGKVGYLATPGGTPRIGGWSAQVLADSKEKAATYLFVSWLAGVENSINEVLKVPNYDASYIKTFQSNVDKYKPEILKRKSGQAEFDGMVAGWSGIKNGRLVDPGVPEFAQFGNEMYPFMAKAVTGELPVKDALDQAAKAGEKILEAAGYYKK